MSQWAIFIFAIFATFCRFKPVKTGKWQKTLFAGKNSNPAENRKKNSKKRSFKCIGLFIYISGLILNKNKKAFDD